MSGLVLGIIAAASCAGSLIFAAGFGQAASKAMDQEEKGKTPDLREVRFSFFATAALSVAGFALAVMAGLAWV